MLMDDAQLGSNCLTCVLQHQSKAPVAALFNYPACRRYVPLGLASWFRSAGVASIVELDWWQEVQHPDSSVKVVFTPAQHWSWRKPWDRKMSLWGSFAVLGEKRCACAWAVPRQPCSPAPGLPISCLACMKLVALLCLIFWQVDS